MLVFIHPMFVDFILDSAAAGMWASQADEEGINKGRCLSMSAAVHPGTPSAQGPTDSHNMPDLTQVTMYPANTIH